MSNIVVGRPYRCNLSPEALRGEESITWLDSPEGYPYLREAALMFASRSRIPGKDRQPGCKLVAIAVLRPDAPSESSGTFVRRCWFVASHDFYEGSGHPCEAVDPHSIKAGEYSLESER